LAVQLLLGILIGLRLDKEVISRLQEIFLPLLIMMIWGLAVTFSLGFILNMISPLDLPTALMSASPGGLPEMTILASRTGANLPSIVVTHSFRLILTVSVLPFLFKKITGKKEKRENGDVKYHEIKASEENKSNSGSKINSEKLFKIFVVVIAGIIGGAMAEYLHVPAGALVGSFILVTIVSVAGFNPGQPESKLYTFLLIGVGIMVSENFSLSSLTDINLIYVAFIAIIYIFLASFILALIYKKITNWDFGVCMMAAAPGGMTAITALVLDMDVDPFQITILQLFRVITLKMTIPIFFVIIS
ncbi:MAG: AbrB family transcriptional regulator, partial [Bacillota bacterium]